MGTMLAFTFGPVECIVIGVVGLLIFGPRLPSVARGLGSSVTEFKKGLREVSNEASVSEKELNGK